MFGYISFIYSEKKYFMSTQEKGPQASFLAGIKKLGRPKPSETLLPNQPPDEAVLLCPIPGQLDIPVPAESVEDLKLTAGQRQYISALQKERIEVLPAFIVEQSIISLWSFDELKKSAGNRVIFDESLEARPGTISDPRMGTIDNNKKCGTCRGISVDCPGHNGIMILPEKYPALHPLYIRDIIRVLNSVCNSCANLMATEELLKEKKILKYGLHRRMKEVEKLSASLSCIKTDKGDVGNAKIGDCRENRSYDIKQSTDKKKIIYRLNKDDDDRILDPYEVFKILDSISDADAKLLGFDVDLTHPRDMIIRGLYVPPMCARPELDIDGKTKPDDLTRVLTLILKDFKKVTNAINAGNRMELQEAIENRDKDIGYMIDNTDGKLSVGRKPLVTIKDKIQGKKGYIRKLVMGKRADNSGRSVASVGTYLKFGEIGVPRELANRLTIAHIVTSQNIDYLNGLLSDGQVNNIYKLRGKARNKKLVYSDKLKNNVTLEIGDKVDRFLQAGDMIMFNRNPSLHKQSIMAAEVVLHDDKTVKIHMSYTSPLNADFDFANALSKTGGCGPARVRREKDSSIWRWVSRRRLN